jgi:hypothetical protein
LINQILENHYGINYTKKRKPKPGIQCENPDPESDGEV